MSKPKIMIADNNRKFLNTCADFFELYGYEVHRVFNPEDARRALDERDVHLAILDLRMIDDNDEKDMSGLMLAKSTNPNIPKIILTGFQTWEAVRESLGLVSSDNPPAVSFVAKQEGLETLLQHTQRAFEKYVPLNWNLEIEWKALDSVQLLKSIEREVEVEHLASRIDELEDLFRLLFQKQQQIRIERVLWKSEGRVALLVFAFEKGKKPDTLMVVCGQHDHITDEAHRYKDFAPKAPTSSATILHNTNGLTHFAANVYTLAGAQLQSIRTLEELYNAAPEKDFLKGLNLLFQKTLESWSQGSNVLEENTTLDDLYRERLHLTRERFSEADFAERIKALARQLPTIGMKIESVNNELRVAFNERSFSYPDPTPYLHRNFHNEESVLLIHTPGNLSGTNVLTDASEGAWVTDFGGAGLAPPAWNYAQMEAVIRFDWMTVGNLQWLHEMERQLVYGDFDKLYLTDIEAPLRKPFKAIHAIRRLAAPTVGKDFQSYHLAMLFQVTARLAKLNPASQMINTELVRPAHLLLTAAVICDFLSKNNKAATPAAKPQSKGLRIDKVNRAVWVDGRRVLLRGHSYNLLCNFYDHPNQLRTRCELIEEVFDEKYDETNASQISRLNTAMHRLRKQLGDESDHPRFILTEQRGGYRLSLNSD
jgi:DNA-binding response OmpR family regulator